MTGFAVGDVETTGVYYRRDQVIEVGVILLDAALGETLRGSTSRKACQARELGVRLSSEAVFDEVCAALSQ